MDPVAIYVQEVVPFNTTAPLNSVGLVIPSTAVAPECHTTIFRINLLKPVRGKIESFEKDAKVMISNTHRQHTGTKHPVGK